LSSGAIIAAWKSIEYGIGSVALSVSGCPAPASWRKKGAASAAGSNTGTVSALRFFIVKMTRSPSRTCTTGPGTVPPNVQALKRTPGATSTSCTTTSIRT
jgi:hypothetical protein